MKILGCHLEYCVSLIPVLKIVDECFDHLLSYSATPSHKLTVAWMHKLNIIIFFVLKSSVACIMITNIFL